ncbi:MAG: hypothetical protein ACXABY_00070 [Candidatus Thorarchaeota archaeon]|jgi:hypothetical protein
MKFLVAAFIAALSAILPAQQTPKASFSYVGRGCGWFMTYPNNDLVCTYPPIIGQYVEFNCAIPPTGTDWMQFGVVNPRFPIGRDCFILSYAFPAPYRVWVSWTPGRKKYNIPNDPALAGRVIYAQQLNHSYGTMGQYWDMTRAVKLTLGY